MTARILRRALLLMKYAASGPALGRRPICETRVVSKKGLGFHLPRFRAYDYCHIDSRYEK
jgi:hypothetical protein